MKDTLMTLNNDLPLEKTGSIVKAKLRLPPILSRFIGPYKIWKDGDHPHKEVA